MICEWGAENGVEGENCDTSICTWKYQQFSPKYKHNEMQNIKKVKMVVACLKVPFQNFPEETAWQKKKPSPEELIWIDPNFGCHECRK